MFERLLCLFVAILSLVSVAYSSQHIEVYNDVVQVATSNYVDVSFRDVHTMNGSSASITSSGKGIKIDSLSFTNVGDYEVIQYEVFNNSYGRDVEVEVYVNGVREFDSEFFHISTSDVGNIKSGETGAGTITITYQKASIDGVKLPFEVELKVKEKGYLE